MVLEASAPAINSHIQERSAQITVGEQDNPVVEHHADAIVIFVMLANILKKRVQVDGRSVVDIIVYDSFQKFKGAPFLASALEESAAALTAPYASPALVASPFLGDLYRAIPYLSFKMLR
ncbi:hypothetical protein Pfo_022450 [Paulownia fortunei]|nr:hypothetical protein Pfo_022450 [Paulownia fortunei]